jgi:hypothetical protein
VFCRRLPTSAEIHNTFVAVADEWLLTKKRALTPATWQRDHDQIHKWVVPYLGDRPIASIDNPNNAGLADPLGEGSEDRQSILQCGCRQSSCCPSCISFATCLPRRLVTVSNLKLSSRSRLKPAYSTSAPNSWDGCTGHSTSAGYISFRRTLSWPLGGPKESAPQHCYKSPEPAAVPCGCARSVSRPSGRYAFVSFGLKITRQLSFDLLDAGQAGIERFR